MTTLVLIEAKISPQRADELTCLLRDLLPSTRTFAGCKGVTAHLSADNGGTLVLVETWESKEAQQKYAAWRRTAEHSKQLVALLEGPPRISYFNPVDV